MSRIFLSHSSENNAQAIGVHDWLIEHGWEELFLDLHPERGLKAGQRWQEALKKAAERCEVVLFLISPAWADSKWCLAEFLLAKQLNKPIFGVIIEPTPFEEIPTEMTAEWQLVDLTVKPRDHERTVVLPRGEGTVTVTFASDGLTRLRLGLAQTGLDPKFFKWPPDHDKERPPYRGLKPLEADDAGIFFGREGPTVIGLDTLRGLREAVAPRILVVLGASGAGKSSFMRAGLLPRLAREDQHFLPLPVIRPERAVLTGDTGFIVSLERALRAARLARSRSDIRDAIKQGSGTTLSLLSELVAAKTSQVQAGGAEVGKPPTIIIPVDQAEELFTSDGDKESGYFLALLRELTVQDAPAVISFFTIRSDNYETLQTSPTFAGLRQHTLSLPPMPQGNYANVITGPLARLAGTARALVIDPLLVTHLLSDVENGRAKDALPLLAFTLGRLYLEFHAAGELKYEHYARLGGIKGSLDAAIERAFEEADKDPAIPKDRETRLNLLRRGLIPWLAAIDPDTKAPRRRVARLSEIPSVARPLIRLLVEQGLLTTDVARETGDATIEPAHEALLRQWGLLQEWLEEDTEFLIWLDGVKRAARDWAAKGKDTSWLSHTGERLRSAERLLARADLASTLDATDQDYVIASRKNEDAATWRRRRTGYLVRALMSALVIGLTYVGTVNRLYLAESVRLQPFFWNVSPTPLKAEIERVLKPAETFVECPYCPKMVVVFADEFSMGSPLGEKGRGNNESPPRKVTITRAFAVSAYEITFREWDACVAHRGCPFSPSSDQWRPKFPWREANFPASFVNWDDAKSYVVWLSRLTNRRYRLLSEAEWEYAARAGTQSAYYWGEDMSKDKANCADCRSGSQSVRQPSKVGSFEPNKFGLYDMLGNLWEWVQDCFDQNYEKWPTDGSARVSGNCVIRTVRGGSFMNHSDDVRSASRMNFGIDNRAPDIGFRVARELSP